MPKNIFKEGKKYTFSDYFEMGHPTEEIVTALGYTLVSQLLPLPQNHQFDPAVLENLRSSYYALVPKISLNSEIAKRELMIAPLLHAVIKTVEAKLNIEYSIEIDEKLSGTIDYLFHSTKALIVIEAKKGDLERGFNQLAAEMIALDKYEDANRPGRLYGAITIGEVWRFAILERTPKTLLKDIHTFRFPEDLTDLFSILKGILDNDTHPE
jgi:hypothetical protein